MKTTGEIVQLDQGEAGLASALTNANARRLRGLALLSCAFLVGCADTASSPDELGRSQQAIVEGQPTATFDWSVSPNFAELKAEGYEDLDLFQLTPSRSAIRNPKLLLILDACNSLDSNGVYPDRGVTTNPSAADLTFDWTLTPVGGGESINAGGDQCYTGVELSPGAYSAELIVTDNLTSGTDRYVSVVEPRNILIVSLGDSVASGEGNPDAPHVTFPVYDEYGAQEGNISRAPAWYDTRCHRSRYSGHAQAARVIERADPYSVVTFLSLACTGASVEDGLLGEGKNPFGDTTPNQLHELQRLLCNADGEDCVSIDALLLSAGANDADFGGVVENCAEPGSDCLDEGKFIVGTDGLRIFVGGALRKKVEDDIAGLDGKFDDLAGELGQFDIGRVYLMEYPDLARNSDGDICRSIVFEDAVSHAIFENPVVETAFSIFDLPKYLGISTLTEWIPRLFGDVDASIARSDLSELNEVFYLPLLEALERAADEHGWTYVDGIKEAFRTHGYCASDSFIVDYTESRESQLDLVGSMHPNRTGHIAIAMRMLARLGPDLGIERAADMTLPEWEEEAQIPNLPEWSPIPEPAGFDLADNWNGELGDVSDLSLDPTIRTRGTGSLYWSGRGYQEISSIDFNSGDFVHVGDRIGIDVRIRELPPDAADWAAIQVYLTIFDKGLNHQYLDQVQLRGACLPPYSSGCLDSDGWSRLELNVPAHVKQALLESSGRSKLHIALNTAANGTTQLNLDNLRFTGNQQIHPHLHPWKDPTSVPVPYSCPMCSTATPLARYQHSGSFGTASAPKLFVVSDLVAGWQASETLGRIIRVNGVEVYPGQMPLPPATEDGKYYFHFSEGSFPWTSWSFW